MDTPIMNLIEEKLRKFKEVGEVPNILHLSFEDFHSLKAECIKMGKIWNSQEYKDLHITLSTKTEVLYLNQGK